MKKFLVISTLTIIVLIALAIGGVLLFANSFVNSQKGFVEQQLSSALGAPITLEDIDVSLFPHLALHAYNVVLKDSSDGTAGLTLVDLRAEVDLIPLLSKRFIITEILLDTPVITLVKNQSGTSIKGMNAGQQPANAPAPTPATAPATATSTPLDLKVERVLIKNGTVNLPADPKQKATSITAINLDAAVSINGQQISVPTLSLGAKINDSLPMTLTSRSVTFSQADGGIAISSANLQSDAGTITLQGSFNTKSNAGTITVNSSGIDLLKLSTAFATTAPDINRYSPSGTVALDGTITMNAGAPPTLALNLRPAQIGAKLSPSATISRLSGTVTLTGPTSNLDVRSTGLSLAYNNAPLKVDVTLNVSPRGTTISTLKLIGFGGQIVAPTNFLNGPPKSFSSKPTASNLNIQEFLTATKPNMAQTLTGTLASFSGNVSGGQSTQADGTFFVTGAALKGSNLPMQVLGKLNEIPIFSGLLTGGIPDKYKVQVSDQDTAIREMSGSFSFAQGQTTLRGVRVVSDMCIFTADGTVAADGLLNLNSTFTFSPDLSMGLVRSFKGLNRALNSAQQLVVPVVIQGKSPRLIVLPDVTKLVTSTIVNIPSEALGIVGGALGLGGGGDKSQTNSPGKKPQGGSNQKQGGLGGILGF
jgi:hypothetical protein